MTSVSASTQAESQASRLLRELRGIGAKERLARLELAANTSSDGRTLEATLIEVIDEAGRLTMVSAAEALEATAFAVELADQSGLEFAKARARRARARALAYAGCFDEALLLCGEAIGIATRCGRTEEAGRARLASMHALTEMGRMDEAISAGEAARKTFERLGEAALSARADNNLGIVFQRRDQPAAAIACFDRAREGLRDDPVALGHVENSRGSALLALNDFAGAEAAFAAACSAFERAGAELTAAIAEGNLGDLAMRRGRLRDSMRYFERARRRFERTNSPGHLARLMAEQAEAKALLGMIDEAIADYGDALERLEKCGMPLEQARARMAMGRALCKAGRFAQAETALAAAAAAFDELNHPTARARVDLARAEILSRNANEQRVRDARTMVSRALAVLAGRPVDAIATRLLLGRLSMKLGELEVAQCELQSAATLADSLDIAPLQCEARFSLGRLHRRRGAIDNAIEHYSLAIKSAERLRSSIQAKRFRAAYLGDRASLYEEAVSCLMEKGNQQSLELALEIAEQCKSRSLLDRLFDADTAETDEHEGADAAERELMKRMRELREELNALYSRLGDDPSTDGGRDSATAAGATGLKPWRMRIRELESQFEEIEARLASAGGVVSLHAPSATYFQIQSALAPGELLVEYFGVGDAFIAFLVSRDRPIEAHALPFGDRSRLCDLLDRFQFQIDRALRRASCDSLPEDVTSRLLHDARRELGALYDVLIAPIESAIGRCERLVIIPHGVLHGVPFHALWDGSAKMYLDDRCTVRTAPSASVLGGFGRARRGKRAGVCTEMLVVAVPDEVAPSMLDEGRELAAAIGATLLAEQDATIAAVRNAAAGSNVLHFACHGRFDRSLPHASGIRLTDGWLTLRDVYDLRLNAQLVLLSACETGLSRVESGDEVLGLQRAFMAAGADSLLLTLWRVPDESTAEFSRIFHSIWHTQGGHMRTAEAARRARRTLRDQHPHPAFWAPFSVSGGDR